MHNPFVRPLVIAVVGLSVGCSADAGSRVDVLATEPAALEPALSPMAPVPRVRHAPVACTGQVDTVDAVKCWIDAGRSATVVRSGLTTLGAEPGEFIALCFAQRVRTFDYFGQTTCHKGWAYDDAAPRACPSQTQYGPEHAYRRTVVGEPTLANAELACTAIPDDIAAACLEDEAGINDFPLSFAPVAPHTCCAPYVSY